MLGAIMFGHDTLSSWLPSRREIAAAVGKKEKMEVIYRGRGHRPRGRTV